VFSNPHRRLAGADLDHKIISKCRLDQYDCPHRRLAGAADLNQKIISKCHLDQYECPTNIVLMDSRPYHITACKEDFEGLSQAIELLLQDGAFEDTITMLVQSPTRPQVVEAMPLRLKPLQDLLSRILEHINPSHDSKSSLDLKSMTSDKIKLCADIQHFLAELNVRGFEGKIFQDNAFSNTRGSPC
jgi:hypothetical protein